MSNRGYAGRSATIRHFGNSGRTRAVLAVSEACTEEADRSGCYAGDKKERGREVFVTRSGLNQIKGVFLLL